MIFPKINKGILSLRYLLTFSYVFNVSYKHGYYKKGKTLYLNNDKTMLFKRGILTLTESL